MIERPILRCSILRKQVLLINKIFVKQGERAPQNALNTAKVFQTLWLTSGLRYLV